jgi:hypothetical protein
MNCEWYDMNVKVLGAAVLAAALGMTSAAAQVAPAAPAPKSIDRISATMAQAGIKRCAPIVRRVAEFLIEDGVAGYRVRLTGAVPDQSPIVLTMESRHRALGTVRYATVSVVPQANCSGFYEQSIYWPVTCNVLKANNFANFPAAKFLHSAVALSEASATVQLAMLPAGGGCVSIKKEIFR